MNGFLLDTSGLLRLRADAGPIGAAALAAVQQKDLPVLVSSISMWEVGLLVRRSEVTLQLPPGQWFAGLIDEFGLSVLDLDWRDALASTELPSIHKDPVDRILIAITTRLDLTVLTSDAKIAAYPNVRVLW